MNALDVPNAENDVIVSRLSVVVTSYIQELAHRSTFISICSSLKRIWFNLVLFREVFKAVAFKTTKKKIIVYINQPYVISCVTRRTHHSTKTNLALKQKHTLKTLSPQRKAVFILAQSWWILIVAYLFNQHCLQLGKTESLYTDHFPRFSTFSSTAGLSCFSLRRKQTWITVYILSVEPTMGLINSGREEGRSRYGEKQWDRIIAVRSWLYVPEWTNLN